MGYPLLVTFDLNISITIKEIRDRILQLIKPFIPDIDINDYKNNNDINNNNVNNDNNKKAKPFVMEAHYSFNNVTQLTDSDAIFILSQRSMKFVIHFNDPQQYHNDGYDYDNRARDVSAPVKTERPFNEYRSTSCINLEECIDIGHKSRLSQENLWYCQRCQNFQCIKKELDGNSWNAPDLFIIHLDRFCNCIDGGKQNYIDMLIKFKIDQGLLVPNKNKDTLYELYAIKNYDRLSGVARMVCVN